MRKMLTPPRTRPAFRQDNQRHRRRLMVEMLEDRTLPAVSLEYLPADIVLDYAGRPVSFVQTVLVPDRPDPQTSTFTADLKTTGFGNDVTISTSPIQLTFGPDFPSTASWAVTFDFAVPPAVGTSFSGKIKANANIPAVSEGSGTDVTINVVPNDPPIADAGGPYTVNEGQSVTLDASNSSDPNNDPLTYSWDVNGDGTFGDTTGVSPTLSWSELNALGIADGPSTISNLRVRVSDGFNPAVDSPATSLTVANVAPTATLTGPTEGVRTIAQTWFLSASDLSSVDQAAGFEYGIDWAEGNPIEVVGATPGNGTSTPVAHAFGDRGTFLVQATATDKDGGVSAPATLSVVMKAAGLLPDPDDPTKSALFIVGSQLADTIEIRPGATDPAQVEVYLTEGAGTQEFLGSFTPTGQVIILPREGDDQVIVHAGIPYPTQVDDTNGNDALTVIGTDAADDIQVQTSALLINGQTVTISGIDSQNLAAGLGNDKLTGPDTDSTWNITGADSGDLNTTIAFSGFENLEGGSANDAFVVSATASLSGTLDGGAGSDTVVVTKDADFDLTDTLLVVSGGPTLQLLNIDNAILTGGPSDNTFTLTDWTGGGSLDGQGGTDSLVYSNSTSYSLSTDAQSNLNGVTVNGITTGLVSIEDLNLQATAGTGTIDASAFTGDLNFAELGNGNLTVLGGQGKNTFVKRPDESGDKKFVGGSGDNQFRIGPGSNVELETDPAALNELSFDLADTPITFSLATPGTAQTVNDRGDTVTFTGEFDVLSDSVFDDVFIAPAPEIDPATNVVINRPTTIVANQGADSLFGTLSTSVVAQGGDDVFIGALDKDTVEAALNELETDEGHGGVAPGLKDFVMAAFDKAVLAGFDSTVLAAFDDAVLNGLDVSEVQALRNKVTMEGNGNIALTAFLTSVEFSGSNNFLVGDLDARSKDIALSGVASFEDVLSGGFDDVLATGFQDVLNVGFDDLLNGGFDSALAGGFAGQIAPQFDAILGSGFDDVLALGFTQADLDAFEANLQTGFETTLIAGFDAALQTAFDEALAGGFNDVLAVGFDDALAGGFEDALQTGFSATLQTAFDAAIAQTSDTAFQDALQAEFQDLLAGGFEVALQTGFDGVLSGGFEQVLASGFDSILATSFDGLLNTGFDAVINGGFDNVLGTGFDDLLAAGFDATLAQSFAGQLSAGFDSALAASFDATLGLSFADVLQSGYDGALKTLFGDPLPQNIADFAAPLLSGFEADLAAGFETELLAGFDATLQQAFDDALAGGFDDVLSGGFEAAVAQGFEDALQRSFDDALAQAFDDALALAFDDALAGGFDPQQSVAFEDALRAGFEDLLAGGFEDILSGGFEGVLAGGFEGALAGGFDSLLAASFDSLLSSSFDNVLASGFDDLLDAGFEQALAGGFESILATGFDSTLASGFDATLASAYQSALPAGADADFADTLLAGFEADLAGGFVDVLQAGFEDTLQAAFDDLLAGGFSSVLAGGFDSALAGGFEDALGAGFDDALQSAFDSALQQAFAGLLDGNAQAQEFADALQAGFDALLGAGFEGALLSGFQGVLSAGFADILGQGFDDLLSQGFDGLLGTGFEDTLAIGFDDLLGAGFDDALASGFDGTLAASFDSVLSGGFADILQSGYEAALGTIGSFEADLLAGFEANLAVGFEDILQTGFDDALQQAFEDVMASGFEAALAGGFDDALAQTFEDSLQAGFTDALQQAFDDALGLGFDEALRSGFSLAEAQQFADALQAGFDDMLAAGFDGALLSGFDGVLAGGFADVLAGGFDGVLATAFADSLGLGFADVLNAGFDDLLGAGFDGALATGFDTILATGFDTTFAAGFETTLANGYQGALPSGADQQFADDLLAGFEADLASGFVDALQAGFEDSLQSAFDDLLAQGFEATLAGGFDDLLGQGFEDALQAGFDDALQTAFDSALQQAFDGPLAGHSQAQEFADALQAGFDALLGSGFETALSTGFEGTLAAGFADVLAQGFDDLLNAAFHDTLGSGFESVLQAGFDDLLANGFDVSLAAGFEGDLQAGFDQTLAAGFDATLGAGYQTALQASFGDTLNQGFADQLLAGFEANLAGGFEDTLQAGFDSTLQQAFADLLSSGFETALAGGFDDALAQAFETELQAGFSDALQQAFSDALQQAFDDSLAAGFSTAEAQQFADALQAGFEDMLLSGFEDGLLSGFDGVLASGFNDVLATGFDDLLTAAFDGELAAGFDNVLTAGFDDLLAAGFDSDLATGFQGDLAAGFDGALASSFDATLGLSFADVLDSGYDAALQASFGDTLNQGFADQLLAGFEANLAGGFETSLLAGFDAALQTSFDDLLGSGFETALAGGFDDLLAQGFEDALQAGFDGALQLSFQDALQQAFDDSIQAGFSAAEAQLFADALQSGFDNMLAGGFDGALSTGFDGVLASGFLDVLAAGFDGILLSAFDSQLSGGFDDMLVAGFDDLLASGFDAALVGAFDDVLQPGFEDTLTGGFENTLATGYQTSLDGSFGGTLDQAFADQLLAGFEANLASGFEDLLQAGFAADLQQAFDDTLAAGFDNALVGGFEDALAGGFEDTVQAGFAAALQQGFDAALQQAFDDALAAGFTATEAQQFADALQAGFGDLLAAGFESALVTGFEGTLAGGFQQTLANGFDDTLRGGFGDRLAVQFVESLLDALRMEFKLDGGSNVIKGGLLIDVTMTGGNNLYIGDTSASAQTLVSAILDNFSSGVESGSAATLFDGIRANVTLQGENNVAKAGLLTTITMGDGPDLFVETLTPSDISLLENTLAALGSASQEVVDAVIEGFSVDVTLGNGNDLAVGGLLANIQGGEGADTFVIEDPVLLDGVTAGSPEAAFVFTLPGGTFEGGLGSDTYIFLGDQIGGVKLVEAPVPGADSDTDSLDFSGYQGGAINLDLADTTAQELTTGKLTVTLSSSVGFEDVVGSAQGDTILGNDRPNQLFGADNQGDDRLTATTVHGFKSGRESVVFLDFTGQSTTQFSQDNPDLVEDYTATEQEQIRDLLANVYAGLHYTFTLTEPTSGPFTRVIFNETPEGGNPGGHANEIDLRNVNQGQDALAATVVIDINGFLGGPGQPELTSENAVKMSATLAAHEVAHASGVVHSDSMGPIGRGIHIPPGPNRFLPSYPGTVQAFESTEHVIASPASVGSSLFDTVGTPFFGERELIKLAFAENWTDVGPDANVVSEGNLATTSVTLGGTAVTAHVAGELPGLEVPNTMLKGLNANKTFDVAAMTVIGNIEIDPATSRSDSAFFAFQGRAGDLINLQVISVGMDRLAEPVDPVARVYGPDGQLMPFGSGFAVNDDDFDGGLSNIVDLVLPSYDSQFTDAEGNFTFYLEVDTFTFIDNPNFTQEQIDEFCEDPTRADACNDTDVGTFEAFITRFAVRNSTDGDDTLSGRGGANLLDGGDGYDTVLEQGNVDFTLTDPSLTGPGVDSLVSIENANLSGGVGGNQFSVDGWNGDGQFNGQNGLDTLVGPNLVNSWQISGQNAGVLNGNLAFSGVDNLIGSAAADTFIFADGQGVSGTIDGSGGGDTLDYSAYTTAVSVDLVGGLATGSGQVAGIQNVIGGSGNDNLFGDGQDNTLVGGGGNDTLSGRGGVNTLDGAAGDDTVLEVGDVNYILDNQSLTGPGSDALSSIENADLTGGAGANLFDISNWTGGGQIDGEGGTDTLVGQNLNNSWQITGQNTGVINGNLAFSDVENLVGGTAGDVFILGDGQGVSGTIDGSGGINTLDYSAYTTSVSVDLVNSVGTGALGVTGIQHVLGGAAADTITGDGQDNILFGGDGSDVIDGAGGNDLIAGENGSDSLTGGSGDDHFLFGDSTAETDTVIGGSGMDVLDYSGNQNTAIDFGSFAVNFAARSTGLTLDLNNSSQAIGGGSNLDLPNGDVENVYGTNAADDIAGNALNNVLLGLAGNDTLVSGAGDDILLGGDGDDTIVGSSGHDLLVGGFGADRIDGSSGDDVMVAGVIFQNPTLPNLGVFFDDEELDVLALALQDWLAEVNNNDATNADSADDILENLGAADDFAIDMLTGSAGANLSIVASNDILTDFDFSKAVDTSGFSGIYDSQEDDKGDVVIFLD